MRIVFLFSHSPPCFNLGLTFAIFILFKKINLKSTHGLKRSLLILALGLFHWRTREHHVTLQSPSKTKSPITQGVSEDDAGLKQDGTKQRKIFLTVRSTRPVEQSPPQGKWWKPCRLSHFRQEWPILDGGNNEPTLASLMGCVTLCSIPVSGFSDSVERVEWGKCWVRRFSARWTAARSLWFWPDAISSQINTK